MISHHQINYVIMQIFINLKNKDTISITKVKFVLAFKNKKTCVYFGKTAKKQFMMTSFLLMCEIIAYFKNLSEDYQYVLMCKISAL